MRKEPSRNGFYSLLEEPIQEVLEVARLPGVQAHVS